MLSNKEDKYLFETPKRTILPKNGMQGILWQFYLMIWIYEIHVLDDFIFIFDIMHLLTMPSSPLHPPHSSMTSVCFYPCGQIKTKYLHCSMIWKSQLEKSRVGSHDLINLVNTNRINPTVSFHWRIAYINKN